jgi:hypothetical protein
MGHPVRYHPVTVTTYKFPFKVPWGAMNLATKLWKIINVGTLTLRITEIE